MPKNKFVDFRMSQLKAGLMSVQQIFLSFKVFKPSLNLLAMLIASLFIAGNSSADDRPTAQLSSKDLKTLPRVYIPSSDLDAVMNLDRIGAILSEAEFEELLAAVIEQSPNQTDTPHGNVVQSADYDIRVDGDRLVGELTAKINAFQKQWSEVRLFVAGWNVQQATLDDQSAAIARDGEDNNQLRLFINEPGQKTLKLQISSPLQAAGGDKAASVGLLGQGASEFRLTLPAGKHLELAALSIERPTDIEQEATYRIPVGGNKNLAFKITDRQQKSRSEVLTFASTAMGLNVQPGEITWVGQTELQVFGQEIDRLVCSVPNSLEITAVESNGLESWELSDDPDDANRTRITLQYRQGIEGRRSMTFRGILSADSGESWSAPTLLIPSLTSHTGAIVVRYPQNVRLQAIEAAGVRAVDANPNSPPTPGNESQANYQIWDEDFQLTFVADLKQQEVHAAMTNVLDVTQAELNLYTAVSLETRLAPLFEFRLRMPSDWEVAGIQVNNAAVQWEIVSDQAGVNEIRVPLNPPLLPDQTRNVSLFSRTIPENWPLTDQTVRIEIPEIRLPQAAMVEALYGVSATEDLEITPQNVVGLDPAGQKDIQSLNSKLQSLGKSVRLGFTYQDTVFSGQLDVGRKPANLTANVMTFFRVDEEQLFTRLETILAVTGGGYRELSILVSEEAGEDLRFTLIRDRAQTQSSTKPVRLVEQLPGDIEDGFRTWTLRFDQYLQGQYRLTTNAITPRGEDGLYSPARIQLPEAQLVSGYIAVEGSLEEHLKIDATNDDGESLTSVDPVDFPAAIYRPQQRVIAGYRSIQPDWQLSATVTEFDRGAVPTVIGHSASITSVLSKAGEFQHRASFTFTAVGAQSLLVNLPEDATLWSTLIDGTPVEVRRSPAGMQVPIAGLNSNSRHVLQLSYSTLAPSMETMGELTAVPPRVSVIDGKGDQQSVEVLSHDWEVHLPDETLLIASDGLFVPVGNLFGGTVFSFLENLIGPPTFRRGTQRTIALGIAVFVLLVIWLIKRYVVKDDSPRDHPRTRFWEVLGVVFVFFLLFALLMPAIQRPIHSARSGSMTDSAEPTVLYMHNIKDEEAEGQEAATAGAYGSIGGSYGGYGGQPTAEEFEGAVVDQIQTMDSPEPAAQPNISSSAGDGIDLPAPTRRFGTTDPQFSGLDLNMPADAQQPGQNLSVNGNMPLEAQDQLSLQIRQSQEILPQSESGPAIPELADGGTGADFDPAIELIIDNSESMKSRFSTGGLLSMTFDLQIPDGTRSQKFHYQGNGIDSDSVDLRVRFANRTTGRILVWSIALGIALLGWWLRNARVSAMVMWSFLTVVLPLALAWVVPVLWQLLLEGVLYGGLLSILFWSIRCCTQCCWNWCPWVKKAPAAMVLAAIFVTSFGSFSNAEEPVPPTNRSQQPVVVIPYESIEEIDAADRIFVPQNVYQQLWNASHPDEIPQSDGPLKFTISEATYRGELSTVGEQSQVTIQARWVVMVMTDQPVRFQIPITGVAVNSVEVGGERAAVQADNNSSSIVVIKGRGMHIVDAALIAPAEVNGLVGQFQVQLQPVGSALFVFDLPETDEELKVQVNGLQRTYRRVKDDDTTRIEVPFDRGGALAMSWYPAAQQGGMNRTVQLETAIAASFRDDGLDLSHGIRARVRQGVINDLTFALPKELAVRELTGADVGGWEIEENDNGRVLKVFFRNEITDTTDFSVNLFQKLQISDQPSTVKIPTLAPQGITRETVQLAVYSPQHLSIRVESTSGLNQIDVSRYAPVVTPPIAGSTPQVAYRSSSRPMEANIRIQRQESESRTIVEHGVHIARRKQLIATRIVWTLTGAPRRRVDIAIPEGYLPISVLCADASDWYVHQSADGQILSIEFPQPKLGRIEAGLEGHVAKLPDETSVELELPHPMEAVGQQATLGVWLDSGYQGAISQVGSWKSIRPDQLSNQYQKLDSQPVQFAFSTNKDERQNVVLDVRTATAKLNGDCVTLIAVGDATIDYGLTLRWNISQAASDTFVFTAPSWLENVELDGAAIRQIDSEDLGDGRTRWTVTLVDPVKEQYLLSVAATIPFPDDETIQTPIVEFESRQPGGAVNSLTVQQQFAFLVNLSPHQMVPVDLNQFESVSADRLPLVIQEELLQQAVEITQVREDKVPAWNVQKMEELNVSKAIVLTAHLETVLELDGSWRTLATYGIRNRGRQFLAITIPDESRILSVFVRKQPSRTVLSTIDGNEVHLIALPQTSVADLSFDVEVLLAGRFDRSLKSELALRGQHFALPSPHVFTQNESEEFGMPVTQTLWTVHFPEEVNASAVTGVKATNLTPHQGDAWLAAEQQTLDRIQADISEMSRIATDSKVSLSRRTQAQNNLKQLGIALDNNSSYVLSNTISSTEAEQQREQLLTSNAFLKQEAEKALEQVKTSGAEGVIVGNQGLQGNRDFIFACNDAIVMNNSGSGINLEADAKEMNFNFIQLDDLAKKSQVVSGKEAASRSKLKSQLSSQQLLGNQVDKFFDQSGLQRQSGQAGGGGIGGGGFGGELTQQQLGFAGQNQQQATPQFNLAWTRQQQNMDWQNQNDVYGDGINDFGRDTYQAEAAGRQLSSDESIVGGVAGIPDESIPATPSRPWSSSGGLSVAMDLPKNSQTLSFSKVGGNPELTLSVQPAETTRMLWGIGWCVVSVIAGLWLVSRFIRANASGNAGGFLINFAIAIGLLGFYLLPTDLAWCSFWVFIFAAFLKVIFATSAPKSATA